VVVVGGRYCRREQKEARKPERDEEKDPAVLSFGTALVQQETGP
jgi:hypothetical protein